MNSSILTRKGQVTIPAGVRKRLGLVQGDRVASIEQDGKIVLQAVKNDVTAMFGIVKATNSVSLEDMDQAIKRRAASRVN